MTKVIPIVGNYFSKVADELRRRGYMVGDRFVKSDLNSIANDIMSLVDDAYERGYTARGNYGTQQANTALLDQVVALAHAVEDIIRARYEAIKRTGVQPDAAELDAFAKAKQHLQRISAGAPVRGVDPDGSSG